MGAQPRSRSGTSWFGVRNARPRHHFSVLPGARGGANSRNRSRRYLSLLRGVTNGGWDPNESKFRLYTLVLATQTLHAVGYAMGTAMDGNRKPASRISTRPPSSISAMALRAKVTQAKHSFLHSRISHPSCFFGENNQYAISVPVSRQSRSPLYLRGEGFGIPSLANRRKRRFYSPMPSPRLRSTMRAPARDLALSKHRPIASGAHDQRRSD